MNLEQKLAGRIKELRAELDRLAEAQDLLHQLEARIEGTNGHKLVKPKAEKHDAARIWSCVKESTKRTIRGLLALQDTVQSVGLDPRQMAKAIGCHPVGMAKWSVHLMTLCREHGLSPQDVVQRGMYSRYHAGPKIGEAIEKFSGLTHAELMEVITRPDQRTVAVDTKNKDLPERTRAQQILKVMSDGREYQAVELARELRTEQVNISGPLSRLTRRGLLHKVRRGTYQIVPQAQESAK